MLGVWPPQPDWGCTGSIWGPGLMDGVLDPGASGPALRAGVTEVLTGMQDCCRRVPDSNLDADVSHQGTISCLFFLASG